jgi:hypothetical protein
MSEQTETVDPSTTDVDDWDWMQVEIMGHREHWGRAREEERFGAKMLRIDIPVKGDPSVHGWATRYYSGPAIFSVTLTDEATVMRKNLPWDAPHRLTYREPDVEVVGLRAEEVIARAMAREDGTFDEPDDDDLEGDAAEVSGT